MSVHRCRMLGLSGQSRDVFAALDSGAGAGHEGNLQSCLGRSRERMCTKVCVLIIEIYRIVGIVNILLDVTFLAPPAEWQRIFSNADSSVVCRRLSSTIHLNG